MLVTVLFMQWQQKVPSAVVVVKMAKVVAADVIVIMVQAAVAVVLEHVLKKYIRWALCSSYVFLEVSKLMICKKYRALISINIKYLISVYKQNKMYVSITALISLLNSIFPLVNIVLPKLVIDAVTEGSDIKLVIFWVIILAFANIAFGAVNTYISNNYLSIQGSIASMQLLTNISRKAAELDINQIEQQSTAIKIELAKNVVYRGIHEDLIAGVFSTIGSMVMLFTTAGMLFSLNPLFILIIIVISIVNIYINFRIELDNISLQTENQKSMTKMNYFTDVLEGRNFIKEIRLYGLQHWFQYKCDETIRAISQNSKNMNKRWYPLRLLQNFGINFMNYGLYLWLALLTFSRKITIGSFTMLFSAVTSFSSNFNNVVSFLSRMAINSEYLSAYNEFMSMESNIDRNTENESSVLIKNDLTQKFNLKFNNVAFRYNEAQELILKNINIEFQKGKIYAIIGKNGAGKTTLINLMCRLYDVESGNITLNGIDIRKIPITQYRNYFSAIFQNFENLAFSIRDNIVLDQNGNDEILQDICEKLSILDFIENTKYGFDTNLYKYLDDNGVILSGGQNQRIAIARALYRNAPVLILDEPSSALDPVSEDALIQLIHKNTEDKVVVYVSHRLSSAKFADSVIFIDGNTIADCGKHEVLYERNGSYREFYDAQAKYYR